VETRILAIDERAFGPDSPETGSDAESLGRLYEHEGRYGAAFPLCCSNWKSVERHTGKTAPFPVPTGMRRQPGT
jgi:hypothetical protein